MHACGQNALKRRGPRRRGYALPLALVFVVLFAAMLGVAWRGAASALRVQSARTLQTRRDQGSIHALALAMRLLETGLPPSSPYVCVATVNTGDGPHEYAVTFVAEGKPNWSVRSAPLQAGEEPPPMPDTFAPADSEKKNRKEKKGKKEVVAKQHELIFSTFR